MSNSILTQYIEKISDINDYGTLIGWINNLSKEVTVDTSIRTPENYVYGCQVATWFQCTKTNNRIYFSFDSDSNVTKGIVKILLDILNGSTVEEIKKLTFYDFRQISMRLPTERQRTLQIILNKAHELANTIGDTE